MTNFYLDKVKKYFVEGDVNLNARLSTILKILNDIDVISDASFEHIKKKANINDDDFLDVRSHLDAVFHLILNIELNDYVTEMFDFPVTDYRPNIFELLTEKGNDAYDRLYYILDAFFVEAENMMYEVNYIIEYE